MKRHRHIWVAIAMLVASGTCNRSDKSELKQFIPPAKREIGGFAGEEAAPARRAPAAPAPAAARARQQGLLKLLGDSGDSANLAEIAGVGGLGTLETLGAVARSRRKAAAPDDKESNGDDEAAPTRAWFPETFLFNPLVVTDASGNATIPVRVPDRLTGWRVLALAHSRVGAQAGAETRFQGTLPAYVDPIVPSFLMAGDEVSLPIQIVNTTDRPLTAALRVELVGAALARAMGSVKVDAESNLVTYAPVRANRPGTVTLRASLGDMDAVERTFPVHPTGRPITETRSGTLASARTFEASLPASSDRESAKARLLVFPGALAILRAELAAASTRGTLEGDAYALLLAGRGETLLRKIGGESDTKALHALAMTAGQRAIRAGRTPDVITAALFTEATLAHPTNPILTRLGERLADTAANGQRPDGTCAGADGWTLQRLLVATADCVRAVRAASGTALARQRASRVTLSAARAFERNIERVEDAYTAAAIASSGTVEGAIGERLRKRIRDAVKQETDGTRYLPVPTGVVRIDGSTPSVVEATALAVLALRDDPAATALLPDLGSRLLAAYDPARGFGDGRTNLVALTAVLSLFSEKLPERVTITFTQDGRTIAEQTLEGTKLREIAAVEVPLSEPGKKHTYELRAEPPVPGLGYSVALKGYVPWTTERSHQGLELSIDTPRTVRLGQPVDISMRAAAPTGVELTIRHALPASVQIDTPSLEALVADNTIRSYDKEDGALILKVAPRAPGQVFTAHYRVIPTLAGKLHTGASTIGGAEIEHHVPPTVWTVR